MTFLSKENRCPFRGYTWIQASLLYTITVILLLESYCRLSKLCMRRILWKKAMVIKTPSADAVVGFGSSPQSRVGQSSAGQGQENDVFSMLMSVSICMVISKACPIQPIQYTKTKQYAVLSLGFEARLRTYHMLFFSSGALLHPQNGTCCGSYRCFSSCQTPLWTHRIRQTTSPSMVR